MLSHVQKMTIPRLRQSFWGTESFLQHFYVPKLQVRSWWDGWKNHDRRVVDRSSEEAKRNGISVHMNQSHSHPFRWTSFSTLSSEGTNVPKSQVEAPPPISEKQEREDLPSGPPPYEPPPENSPSPKDIIHQLLANPALYNPLRPPRNPIVLCHGLYGFDTRGPTSFPSLRMHYWANVLKILRGQLNAQVIVTSVPATGSIASRALVLDEQLRDKAHGKQINFLAHSMGGLDCRHLITHVKATEYEPLSLTTISTPHRGSAFMDWCAENLGLGKLKNENLQASRVSSAEGSPSDGSEKPSKRFTASESKPLLSLSLSSLPSSFTTFLLSVLDSPAYANLTTDFLNKEFNPATPDDPKVKYFSVAGRMPTVNIWHPFWLPKLVMDSAEGRERSNLRSAWEKDAEKNRDSLTNQPPLWAQEDEWGNDGLVTVQSAKWGEFLGVLEGCDHWEMRGARGIEFGVDLPALPAIGLGSSLNALNNENNGDGWGWFVKTRKKNDKDSVAVQGSSESTTSRETVTEVSFTKGGKARRLEERKRNRERDDDIVKSSTEKLSTVLDWIVEQVPAPQILGYGSKTDAMNSSAEAQHKEKPEKIKQELKTREDLERFYVALTRKLYDEGL